MKRLMIAATASLIALSGAAHAEPHRKDDNRRGSAVQVAPGQVKKQEVRQDAPKPSARRFAPGERIPEGHRSITNYRDHGLPNPGSGYRYVSYDNNVYKISTETAAVVAVIGALSALQ